MSELGYQTKSGYHLELTNVPTAALERWLEQYRSFVAQTEAELEKRIASELAMEVEK